MKSFNEVYEKLSNEKFHELEKERKKVKIKAFVIITMMTIPAVIACFSEERIGILLVWAVMFGGVLYSNNDSIFSSSKIIELFKKNILIPFVDGLDEGLKCIPYRGVKSEVYSKGDFEYYDEFYSHDLIEGTIDGKYDLEMAEVTSIVVHEYENSTTSQIEEREEVKFHGIFAHSECAKNIISTMKIRSDKGKIGILSKYEKKVELDSQEFEKYFDVYEDNKIVAMQILTAELMDKMIEFRKTTGIKFEITIDQYNIYIRFATGQMFEPKLFKKTYDYKIFKEYYKIIELVLNIVREINKALESTEF